MNCIGHSGIVTYSSVVRADLETINSESKALKQACRLWQKLTSYVKEAHTLQSRSGNRLPLAVDDDEDVSNVTSAI